MMPEPPVMAEDRAGGKTRGRAGPEVGELSPTELSCGMQKRVALALVIAASSVEPVLAKDVSEVVSSQGMSAFRGN